MWKVKMKKFKKIETISKLTLKESQYLERKAINCNIDVSIDI